MINHMKLSLLFIFVTTFMSCTSRERQSEDGVGRLPDWAFGGFASGECKSGYITYR